MLILQDYWLHNRRLYWPYFGDGSPSRTCQNFFQLLIVKVYKILQFSIGTLFLTCSFTVTSQFHLDLSYCGLLRYALVAIGNDCIILYIAYHTIF